MFARCTAAGGGEGHLESRTCRQGRHHTSRPAPRPRPPGTDPRKGASSRGPRGGQKGQPDCSREREEVAPKEGRWAGDRRRLRRGRGRGRGALSPAMGGPVGGGGAWECAVCREVMCKPVVPPCGHAFCFSCGHRAMNPWAESRCPLCRGPFRRFPRSCRALHGLLSHAFPDAYADRLKEVEQETSKEFGTASPQVSLDGTQVVGRECGGGADEAECRLGSGHENNEDFSRFFGCSFCHRLLLRPVVLNCGHSMCRGCFDRERQKSSLLLLPGGPRGGSELQKEMSSCRCHVCGEVQLGDVQVCQIMHQFLEAEYPKEQKLRRAEEAAESAATQGIGAPEERGASSEAPATGLCTQGAAAGERSPAGGGAGQAATSGRSEQAHVAMPTDPGADGEDVREEGEQREDHPPDEFVHFGVGCDSCGAFPIVGRRYRCVDCPEAIGYDLCALCMSMGTSVEGRFDQSHKPDHKMVEVLPEPTFVHKLALRNGESIESIMRLIEMVTEMRDEDDNEAENGPDGPGETAGGADEGGPQPPAE